MVSYRAIGYADEPAKRKATAIFKSSGMEMYALTALLMVEAGMTILKEKDTDAHKMRGVVTNALLGEQYIDRLRKAGIEIDVQMTDK